MLRRAAAALARPSPPPLLLRSFSSSPPPAPSKPASPHDHNLSVFGDDPASAFKDKTDIEIARAWLVFRLCSIKPIVDNAPQLLKLSRQASGGVKGLGFRF